MNKSSLRWLSLLLLCANAWLAPLARASDTELQLKAVFLGRFANYVQWPHPERTPFVISVLGAPSLGEQLTRLYADKRIQGKPVLVRSVTSIHDLDMTHVLFIATPSTAARQEAIAYAQRHGILSISDSKGFADQGGVIQLNFVEQNTQIKINHDAAMKTGLHIAAPLLSIATVLRGPQP